MLGADECRLVDGPVSDGRIAVLDHDGDVTRGDHTVDVDRVGMPSDDYVAIPVHRGSRVVGHFLVTATSRVTYPTAEQRRVAVLLADQVAAAVDARVRPARSAIAALGREASRQERVKTRVRRYRATQHGLVRQHPPPGERVDLGVDPHPLPG